MFSRSLPIMSESDQPTVAALVSSAPVPALRALPVNALALAALGVVFGDIGTSPLYTYQTALAVVGHEDLELVTLGVLSLIFWALTLVVTVKYLWFVTRADNRGEGGVFALLALVRKHLPANRNLSLTILLLLFGTGLVMGDGVITPAISVLSAIQGLTVVTPTFTPWVVPVTCVILVLLFSVQKFGTGALSAVFAPVMLLWFATLGATGAWQIFHAGGHVLWALNPWYAVNFLRLQHAHAGAILGAVVLCVTGAEALYADLGHFGRPAIARAWYWVAWPALVVNYFGQGALVLAAKGTPDEKMVRDNPFFNLVHPGWATYLLVGLSTVATIIASQALISGVFSLARQAMQLDYAPALKVTHTSDRMEGHIYLPFVNYTLGILCVATVLLFKTSNELANAYGLAVTGTMLVTTLAYGRVRHQHLGRPWWDVAALMTLFLLVDGPFFWANLSKFTHGGWYPMVLGLVVFGFMFTWRSGRNALHRNLDADNESLAVFLQEMDDLPLIRHPGTAVYMTAFSNHAPGLIVDFMRINRCLPERVILLIPQPEPVAHADATLEPARLEQLAHGFFRLYVPFGYREQPDLLAWVDHFRADLGPGYISNAVLFYSSLPRLILDEIPLDDGHGRHVGHYLWRKTKRPFERLFQFMMRNARPAFDTCRLPEGRGIEVVRRFRI